MASAAIPLLFPPVALPREAFFWAMPIAFVLLGLMRYAFESFVDEDIFKRRVLVYGGGRRALSVTQLRRRHDRRGFHVLGYVPTPAIVAPLEFTLPRALYLGVMLFTTGAGILIYQNIGDIGHVISIGLLTAIL